MNDEIKVGDICYDEKFSNSYFFKIVRFRKDMVTIKPIVSFDEGKFNTRVFAEKYSISLHQSKLVKVSFKTDLLKLIC